MSWNDAGPYALLVIAGVAGGFINTMAGGGSLLTLPALMLTGLPVHLANGTNRLSIVTHSLAGVLAFRRAGALPAKAILPVALPTVIGAVGGALLASRAPPTLLKPVLLGTLVTMALVLLVRPKLVTADPEEEEPAAVHRRPLAVLGLLLAGVYGGFVQAGVGFVLLGVLGGLLRYDAVRGNALKLVCTLLFGLSALAVFVQAGHVRWVPAAVLAASTTLGAQLGVRFALQVPARVLRAILFVTVVAASVAAALR